MNSNDYNAVTSSSRPALADIKNCLCNVPSMSMSASEVAMATEYYENSVPFNDYLPINDDRPIISEAFFAFAPEAGDNSTIFDSSSHQQSNLAAINCFFWRPATSSTSRPPLIEPTVADRNDADGVQTTSVDSYIHFVEDVLYQRVAVAICCFGLVGNAVNIAVLAAAGRRHSLGGTSSSRMQQFARLGLVALAIADSSFCLSVLPHAFVERDPLRRSVDFSLFYAAYGESFINWFAMSGTWLTVAMAVGRYAAVCHPFRARAVIGRSVALRSIAVVFVACFVANIPRFMSQSIESVSCPIVDDEGNETGSGDDIGIQKIDYYFRWYGPLHAHRNPALELAYFWAYFIVAVAAPLVVLIFTGCRLGVRLRRSRREAAERDVIRDVPSATVTCTSVGFAPSEQTDRPFTVTLVAVAAMHVILVSPAELLNVVRQRLLLSTTETENGVGGDENSYNLLATVLNVLQASNYSMNFLLYCAVNVAFRRRLVEMVGCRMSESLGGHAGGGTASIENRIRLRMLLNSGALVDLSSSFSARGGQQRMLRSSAGDRSCPDEACNVDGQSSSVDRKVAARMASYGLPESEDGQTELSRSETMRLQLSID